MLKLLYLAIGIALLIVFPVLVIWALNALFALGIPYTLHSWFATLIILSVVGNLGRRL